MKENGENTEVGHAREEYSTCYDAALAMEERKWNESQTKERKEHTKGTNNKGINEN